MASPEVVDLPEPCAHHRTRKVIRDPQDPPLGRWCVGCGALSLTKLSGTFFGPTYWSWEPWLLPEREATK